MGVVGKRATLRRLVCRSTLFCDRMLCLRLNRQQHDRPVMRQVSARLWRSHSPLFTRSVV
jgi:hypothetical protein